MLSKSIRLNPGGVGLRIPAARRKVLPNAQQRSKWLLWYPIAMLFFGAQLLLPVERGFTIVRVFGAPLYLPLIINFAGVIAISLTEPIRTISKLAKPWVVLNLIFAVFCFFSSLLSTTWDISLFYSYMWISNFVLCFLLIDFFLDKIAVKGITIAICSVAAFQIVIGICEGFFQTRFAIYELSYFNYLSSMGAVYFGDRGTSWDLRILGTLGDPILFGTVLMLSIPFIEKLNHKTIRYSLIGFASVIALMTLSRTVLLFFACYLLFYLWTCSFSKKIIASCVIVAAILVGSYTDNVLSNNWSMRLNEEGAAQELGGLELRKNMTVEAVEYSLLRSDFYEALCGHGFYSSAEIARGYQKVSTTIDNTYATILYENGVIGLMLYLGICLLPFWKMARRGNLFLIAAYVGMLLCGFSFVTPKVFSVNLLMVTIVAVFGSQGSCRTGKPGPTWKFAAIGGAENVPVQKTAVIGSRFRQRRKGNERRLSSERTALSASCSRSRKYLENDHAAETQRKRSGSPLHHSQRTQRRVSRSSFRYRTERRASQ